MSIFFYKDKVNILESKKKKERRRYIGNFLFLSPRQSELIFICFCVTYDIGLFKS